jgi:hypothetical protein
MQYNTAATQETTVVDDILSSYACKTCNLIDEIVPNGLFLLYDDPRDDLLSIGIRSAMINRFMYGIEALRAKNKHKIVHMAFHDQHQP